MPVVNPSQIEKEYQDLINAPLVDLSHGQSVPRCHCCGQIAQRVTIMDIHRADEHHQDVVRMVGECCRAKL
jgi:hypothetical protein